MQHRRAACCRHPRRRRCGRAAQIRPRSVGTRSRKRKALRVPPFGVVGEGGVARGVVPGTVSARSRIVWRLSCAGRAHQKNLTYDEMLMEVNLGHYGFAFPLGPSRLTSAPSSWRVGLRLAAGEKVQLTLSVVMFGADGHNPGGEAAMEWSGIAGVFFTLFWGTGGHRVPVLVGAIFCATVVRGKAWRAAKGDPKTVRRFGDVEFVSGATPSRRRSEKVDAAGTRHFCVYGQCSDGGTFLVRARVWWNT